MADGKLQGRVALITGASRNIGRAVALAFAAEGADLVVNTRANGEELEAVAAECRKAGVRVLPVLADVADAAAVESMVARGLAELGAIDILVCNAAIRPHKALTETSLEEWHRVPAAHGHQQAHLPDPRAGSAQRSVARVAWRALGPSARGRIGRSSRARAAGTVRTRTDRGSPAEPRSVRSTN